MNKALLMFLSISGYKALLMFLSISGYKALLMFLSISGYSEQGIVNVFVYKWLQ